MQLEEDNLVTNELWLAAAMPDVTVTAPSRRKQTTESVGFA